MMVSGLPSSTRNAPSVPLRCPVPGWLAEPTPGTRPRPTLPRMAVASFPSCVLSVSSALEERR